MSGVQNYFNMRQAPIEQKCNALIGMLLTFWHCCTEWRGQWLCNALGETGDPEKMVAIWGILAFIIWRSQENYVIMAKIRCQGNSKDNTRQKKQLAAVTGAYLRFCIVGVCPAQVTRPSQGRKLEHPDETNVCTGRAKTLNTERLYIQAMDRTLDLLTVLMWPR